MVKDAFIRNMKGHVEFITVCPETEIGLGVPRSPIRIVEKSGERRLLQPETGLDITQRMNEFCKSYLSSLEAIDGFILKSRSPSCGIYATSLYKEESGEIPGGKGSGFFGSEITLKYPLHPTEDELRLRNSFIRKRFLTALFTLCRFRLAKSAKSAFSLMEFHGTNKLLLMAYDQKAMREMGALLANRANRDFADISKTYELALRKTMSSTPNRGNITNALQHAIGYFKSELGEKDKYGFNRDLNLYRKGKIPLSEITEKLVCWIDKYENDYLSKQTIFHIYPDVLDKH